MINLNMYWLKKDFMTLVLDWQQTPRGHIFLTPQCGFAKSSAYVGKELSKAQPYKNIASSPNCS
jgi:hypothetical protein